jgi:hypothetical protein
MYKAIATTVALAALLTTTTTVSADEDIGLCCLCGGCGHPVSGRSNFMVDSKGKTCSDLVLEMADPSNGTTQGNSECRRMQGLYRRTCCDASFNPTPVKQDPKPSPGDSYPQQEHPSCDLCHDGRFPAKDNTVVAIVDRFVPGGPFTCEQLYWKGRKGHIPDQICKPFQDFADRPCGCGHFDSLDNNNKTPTPPHQATVNRPPTPAVRVIVNPAPVRATVKPPVGAVTNPAPVRAPVSTIINPKPVPAPVMPVNRSPVGPAPVNRPVNRPPVSVVVVRPLQAKPSVVANPTPVRAPVKPPVVNKAPTKPTTTIVRLTPIGVVVNPNKAIVNPPPAAPVKPVNHPPVKATVVQTSPVKPRPVPVKVYQPKPKTKEDTRKGEGMKRLRA